MSIERKPVITPNEDSQSIWNKRFGRRAFNRGVASVGAATIFAPLLAACERLPKDFRERIQLPELYVFSDELQEGEKDKADHILSTKLLNDPPRFGKQKQDDFTKERVDLEKERVEEILSSGDFGQMYRGFWYIHTAPAREMLLDGLTYIRERKSFPQRPDLPQELKQWCKDHGIRKEVLAICRDRYPETLAFIDSIKGEIGRASESPLGMMINTGGAASVLMWETTNYERVGDHRTADYWEKTVKDQKKQLDKLKNSRDPESRKAAQEAYDIAVLQKNAFYEYIERLSSMTGLRYHADNIAGGPTGEIGCQVMPVNLTRFDDLMQQAGERFNAFSGMRFYDFICLMFAERFFDGEGKVVSNGYARGYGKEETRKDGISRYNPFNPNETNTIYDNTKNYSEFIDHHGIDH